MKEIRGKSILVSEGSTRGVRVIGSQLSLGIFQFDVCTFVSALIIRFTFFFFSTFDKE